MMLHFILVLLAFQNSDVPFKASGEFEVKLDLQIKPRYTDQNSATVEMMNSQDKKKVGNMAPYLVLKVNLLKLSDQEIKAKVIDGTGSVKYNKKVKQGASIKLDLGFIQDIKDRVNTGEYNLFLSSASRNQVSRIKILVSIDGTYSVNEIVYGKF